MPTQTLESSFLHYQSLSIRHITSILLYAFIPSRLQNKHLNSILDLTRTVVTMVAVVVWGAEAAVLVIAEMIVPFSVVNVVKCSGRRI